MSAPTTGFSKDDYCTPPEVLALVYAAIGIPDLDPCGNADSLVVSKQALRGGREEEDGLIATWDDAQTVFMNPPYSNTQKWVSRFFDWYEPGLGLRQQGVMLLSAETGLVWWQEKCLHLVDRMYFLPRTAFLAGGKPVKGTRFNSVLLYVGHRKRLIRDVWPRPVFRPCG